MGTLIAVLLGLTIESCGQSSRGETVDAKDHVRCAVTQPVRKGTAPKKKKIARDKSPRSGRKATLLEGRLPNTLRIICERVRVGNRIQLACKFAAPKTGVSSRSALKSAAKSAVMTPGKNGASIASANRLEGSPTSRKGPTGSTKKLSTQKGSTDKGSTKKWIPEPVPFVGFGR